MLPRANRKRLHKFNYVNLVITNGHTLLQVKVDTMSNLTKPSALADLLAYIRTLSRPSGNAYFDPRVCPGQISAVLDTLAACYRPPLTKPIQDRAGEIKAIEPAVDASNQSLVPSKSDENDKLEILRDLQKS